MSASEHLHPRQWRRDYRVDSVVDTHGRVDRDPYNFDHARAQGQSYDQWEKQRHRADDENLLHTGRKEREPHRKNKEKR